MARRRHRTGGAAQVTPDALLARRTGAPCSLDVPVSVMKEQGGVPLSLFPDVGRRSVFDEVGIELVLASKDPKAGAPRLVFDRKIYTVNASKEDMKSPFSSTSVFTETSKMACPSFSLPAGPTTEAGTCPAANQSRKGGLREDGKVFVCDECVTGETLILVKGEGLVRIDELATRKEEFVAWSGLGWRTTRAKMTAVAPVVRIETNFGMSIRLTSDHIVKTADGEFVEAGNLGPKDRLSLEPPDESPFPEKALLPIQMTSGRRHHNAVEEHFPREWNYEVGLFLGYVLGDGAISYGDYPTINLCSSGTDRRDLERINDFVKGWCSTKSEVKEVHPEPNPICDSPGTGAIVKWRVKGLSEFVDGLGLDKQVQCSERRAPPSIFKASRDGVRGFLSGLFSTDGSVAVYRGEDRDKTAISLASVSVGLLRDVQLLLLAFGICSSICPYRASNKKRIEEGHHELWKLEISSFAQVKKFRDEVGFFSRRKQDKLEEAIRSHRVLGPHWSKAPQVTRIVREDGEEPVYDLVDVGDEHQFVGNGLSVHNCYAFSLNYIFPNVALAQAARLMWVRRQVEEDPSGRMLGESFAAAIEDYARDATLCNAPDGVGQRLVIELGVKEKGRLCVPVRLPSVSGYRRMPCSTPLPPESGFRDTDEWREANGVPEGAVCGFFRIHDSGDYGVLTKPSAWETYANAWKIAAESLPHVQFWVPTRMWMWDKLTACMGASPPNLSVRPSALSIDDDAPVIEGLVAGSAVFGRERMRATQEEWTGDAGQTWPCPVYSQGGDAEKKSCMGSGCRACWLWKKTPVAYKWH